MAEDTALTHIEHTETSPHGHDIVEIEDKRESTFTDVEMTPYEEIGGEGYIDEQDEQYYGEEYEGEETEGEYINAEEKHRTADKVLEEGEELTDESEEEEEGNEEAEELKMEELVEEIVEEEENYEEPPPDPTAPYDFSDSKEALKAPFELRPEQLAEVEQLWELYQNYTPAYAELDGYITEKELVYMLKCLLIMTYTPEQLQELIDYCVRPPHPEGHINFQQFVKMVTLRQRDFPIEEELRCALEVMDPEKTGIIDREYLREVVGKLGYKMPSKHLDTFIKEVDMSNDGTIGIEDVVGTLCIDLNRDDIVMLMNTLNPPEERSDRIDDLL